VIGMSQAHKEIVIVMVIQRYITFDRLVDCVSCTWSAKGRRGTQRQVREAFGGLIFLLLVTLPVWRKAVAQANTSTPIYLDSKQSIQVRVDDLMRRMTLKEKVGQLNLPCAYVDELGKTRAEKMAAAKKFAAGGWPTIKYALH
jgi:hypothetical protein